MKWYVTFGQVHVHSVNGKTFDKDCVAVIHGATARACDELAFELFKGKFHQHTPELPDMSYYPRGLIDVNNETYEVHRICFDCGKNLGQCISRTCKDVEVPCPHPKDCNGE